MQGSVRGFSMVYRIQRRVFPRSSILEDFFSTPLADNAKLHLFFVKWQVALEKLALFAEFWNKAGVSNRRGLTIGWGD
jgi:hypothetical protein